MSLPPRVSLTVTNNCNLRCRMCGQWSETGYMRTPAPARPAMTLDDWKRVVDEMAANQVTWALVRGGEPFLLPGIIDLLAYMRSKGLNTSVDTNGTMLKQYAADLVRIGGLHMTISVDGPEEIHDAVRGVKGTFRRIEEGLAVLREAERATGGDVALSICFTISRYSYRGLGEMADVARRLGIPEILIVPYYYYPESTGRQYEEELRALGCGAPGTMACPGYSWRGFHHEESGVDFDEFLIQLRKFRASLGSLKLFPYMDFSEEDYRTWFADATTPVGSTECWMTTGMADIQPSGDVNFCVDTPDYSIGNVKESTLAELWKGERAERFREYRRAKPLAVCHRCGAKYMAAPPILADILERPQL